MGRGRLSAALLTLVLLATLLLPAAALADGPDAVVSSMQGTWNVSVHWYNPEGTGTFGMNVTMLTPNFGRIDTGDHTGILITNGQVALWTIDQPWVALYFGAVSNTSGSGKMINRYENYGTWSASKVSSAPLQLSPGADAGLVTGE
jgi:hypothetical protein